MTTKKLHICIAIAFAVTMLITSYLIRGSEQTSSIVIMMSSLYVIVMSLINQNHKTAD